MMDKEREMLLEQELLIRAEERSNTQYVLEINPNALTLSQAAEPLETELSELEVPDLLRRAVEERAAQSRAESLFEMICRLIRRLGDYTRDGEEMERLRKKAAVKGRTLCAEDELLLVRFYTDAGLTPSVWSDIRLNTAPPSEQTLFKLAIALRLNEADAEMLMKKAGKAFIYNNREHELVLNILRSGKYDLESVVERIETHRRSSQSIEAYFDNMYDSRSEKKAKRIAFMQTLGGKEKKSDEELFELRFMTIRNDGDQLRKEILRVQSKLDILSTNYSEKKTMFEGEWKAFRNDVARKKQWLEECIARLKKRIQELDSDLSGA